MQEIWGHEDESATRLWPLGWTAIRRIGKSTHLRGTACANTGYLHTFRAQILSPDILDIVNTSDEYHTQAFLGPQNKNRHADPRRNWDDTTRKDSQEKGRTIANLQQRSVWSGRTMETWNRDQTGNGFYRIFQWYTQSEKQPKFKSCFMCRPSWMRRVSMLKHCQVQNYKVTSSTSLHDFGKSWKS